MQRDQILYFFDFFLCPPLIVYFLFVATARQGEAGLQAVTLYGLFGLFLWTFIEYWVHRAAFHRAPGLRQMHAAHHDKPNLLIGSPPLVLPFALILLSYILFSELGVQVRAAICAGTLIGYFVYSFVHYATHHVASSRWRYLARTRRRHLLHHFASQDRNFGVTTNLWDCVFATALSEHGPGARRGVAHVSLVD